MKWSRPLVTLSIGTRATALQSTPLDEVLKTMSLAEHFSRKRQSCHATKTRPAPSISAVGSWLVRRPPATAWARTAETVRALDQEAPPSVERKAAVFPSRLSNGTITVPLGWTTGWPPRPLAWPAVSIGVVHAFPPFVGGDIRSRSPSPKLSSSV